MTKYTIGIIFNDTFDKVVLINKKRPSWQAGRLNFPGGHIEEGETPVECVAREIKEECDLNLPPHTWSHIGQIVNEDVPYTVDIFAATAAFSPISMTDEEVAWYDAIDLPKNVLSNLIWIVPFARNYFVQGNRDNISFGIFNYKNK